MLFAPGTLNLDGERPRVRLAYAYGRGFGRVPKQADIRSIWTEPIHQIGRQPTKGIDGEVEAIRGSNRNGITVFGLFVWWPGGTQLALSHDFTMPV
jgi:hypothetical protein